MYLNEALTSFIERNDYITNDNELGKYVVMCIHSHMLHFISWVLLEYTWQ